MKKKPFIDRISTGFDFLEEQKWEHIKVDVRFAPGKSSKWKSREKDKILNFWQNAFPESHEQVTKFYNNVL